jgi:molecular chaperone GrpE
MVLKRERDAQPDLLPPADLARHIDTLEEQLRIERDRYLRTLADLTNYRRRTEREGKRSAEEGKREIILPLLGIVDDIEKALQWADAADQHFVEGIRQIHRKLQALLEVHGVRPFDSLHVMFDHDIHDAVAVAESTGESAGLIVDEVRRGYTWPAGVLRPAQVRVAG